jgi:hypothetical protein
MAKKLIIFFLAALLVSCSMNTGLSRKYEGKGVEVLYKELGSPKLVRDLGDGTKLFEYEKETFVKETEFGTGRGTLDPKISPAFIKVETYWFKVDKNGIIVQADYKKRIDR